jgi:predicted nucleic acid-binding protein
MALKQRGLPTAVIDNTLLSRLVSLEIAVLLPLLFKRVLIPPEVKREAYKAPSRGKRPLRKLIAEMGSYFVDCYKVDEVINNILKVDLDDGEAAAIAQAEYTGSVVLLDEKKAYRRAETMELTVIRTTKILTMLKKAGAIEAVKPYFDKLQKTGFYLGNELRSELLLEADET